ncbi:MAG: winged helix-turn-helix domain-containing protein, partial [Kangiellaceae bacterium]|nr:winged helix-turn-helix domain-containing protein [Kangiellaceae bacterium]
MGLLTVIYSFGQFELDSRKREITCDKQLIKVQPRVYKLILLLIDNSDRAVDKNEIQDLIWPNQIVSETSLSRLVMKARKALKDSSESPQYIKTVHGFGFQCVATIIRKESKIEHNHTPVTANPEAPSSLEIKNAKEKPVFKLAHYRKLRWFVPLFITTLIIIGSVLALSYYLTPTTSVAERVVILPVINHIKDKEHNWVSLGIPSLVNTMLEQSKQVEVVDTKLLLRNKLIVKWMNTQSHSDSKTANPILTNKLLLSLKADLGATKIIYSTLEEQGDILILTYSIHQNTTQVPSYKLSANTPTQMAKLLTEKLIDTETHPIEKLATHSISVNQFVNTLYGKGQSLLLQGQTQKARDLFKVAVSEEPELFWPRYSYALTSRKLGKWKLSEQELLSLLKHPEIKMIHRAESRTRNVLGFVYYRLKQYSKALTQYDIAFKLSATENDPALQAGIADNVG